MTTKAAEDLRYPIGEFNKENNFDSRTDLITSLEELPEKVREAVEGLSNEQLDTEYRPGGWTVRQTVHHIADSHMNACIRFKLALTEDNPTIRPYFEDRWARLADSR